MASSQAQLVLNRLNSDAQDKAGMAAFVAMTYIAAYGTNTGLTNPVDDAMAQLDATFPASGPEVSWVSQLVGPYLASMRESMAQGG